jgi:MoxR-like ATPase
MKKEPLSFESASESVRSLKDDIIKLIFGQDDLLLETLCAFLSRNHILITGAPGLAKTTLVRVIAQKLGLGFGRIQFTPDLLPTDITGSEILQLDQDSQQRSFKFSQGPIFSNLLLADEINRASPRTQSALLEAMQERSVTVGGTTHPLSENFMVFATQNPYEFEGTFPLPEAQLDRFLFHSIIGYPSYEAESKIISEHVANSLVGEEKIPEQKPMDNIAEILSHVKTVKFPDYLVPIILDITTSTRVNADSLPSSYRNEVRFGAGPRASIGLVSASRAFAFFEGEKEVRWRHVERMVLPVLRHRVRLRHSLGQSSALEDEFVVTVLNCVKEKHIKTIEA